VHDAQRRRFHGRPCRDASRRLSVGPGLRRFVLGALHFERAQSLIELVVIGLDPRQSILKLRHLAILRVAAT
jgi:hypothetical protein